MSSSRYPGKVLEPLSGMPMIAFMVDRVRRARRIDDVIVVTSVDSSDDPLAAILAERRIPSFRGDLNDVLARYACAARTHDSDIVVRLTGDCPLIDPEIIDRIIDLLDSTGSDYASNVDPPSYADGLDVEAFTRATLERADREASSLAEREHVTLWMRSEQAGLRRACLTSLVDSSHLRLTVDYPDDLAVVRRLVNALGDAPAHGDHYDMLRCIDRDRSLLDLNRHARNEGLTISLEEPRGDDAALAD